MKCKHSSYTQQQNQASIELRPGGGAFNFANVHARINHDVLVELGNAENKLFLAILELEFRKSQRHGSVCIVIGNDLEKYERKKERKQNWR